MGLLVFVAKIVLTVLNTAFAMLSLIMVGIGCALFYAGDIIIPFTNLLLAQLSARGAINQPSLDVSGFDIATIATQIAWPMVMCGAVLFCVSFVGCCGANCENKLLLLVYSIVMTVIIVAEVLAVIILAGGQDTFKQQAIDQANGYVKDQYRGDNSSDAFSVVMNVAQMNLQCCGVDNYTTLQKAIKWERTGTFSDEAGNSITTTMLLPFSCCNMTKPFPSFTPVDINCVKTLDVKTSYYNTSCFSKVETLLNQNSYWAIIGTLGFIGVQVAIVVLALLIVSRIGKGVNPLI